MLLMMNLLLLFHAGITTEYCLEKIEQAHAPDQKPTLFRRYCVSFQVCLFYQTWPEGF